MQIVIDIPDEVVKNETYGHYLGCMSVKLDEVLNKGIILPKGHGRLIDVGQCDRKLFYQQCGGADSLITVKSAFDMLISLPPIIEADEKCGEYANEWIGYSR